MIAEAVVRRGVKTAALPLGLSRRAGPSDLTVLLYHRVGINGREIDLDAGAFRRQMAYVAAGGRVVRLDEAIDGRGRGGVVVTFDDGYADFHRHALPVLAELGIPAVLYLVTSWAEGDADGPEGPGLSWSQVREAHATGLVTVGAHTHTHADLSGSTEAEAEDEMRRSKDLIEDRLGVSCDHFAYPWQVTGPAAELVAARHFRTAALRWATNRAGRWNPLRLGRTPVLRNDGDFFFRAKVRGALDAEAHAYRLLRRGPWRRP